MNAPTLVAHTALGDVGYREVGDGSSIVLITGFGASMDNWAPSFVDALAAHHRVVVFDNAGVGETAPPAGPLTVSGMADQTSALISALCLHRPAVLGWSIAGIPEYPALYGASPAVRVDQDAAIAEWMAGDDPSGPEVGRIHVPILIADGAQDALDPAPDASILAHAVHGAPAMLFPDAGHAFPLPRLSSIRAGPELVRRL